LNNFARDILHLSIPSIGHSNSLHSLNNRWHEASASRIGCNKLFLGQPQLHIQKKKGKRVAAI
jgi:hypothetical protein